MEHQKLRPLYELDEHLPRIGPFGDSTITYGVSEFIIYTALGTHQLEGNTTIPKYSDPAGPGFVVCGVGSEALNNAYDIFINGKKPLSSFPTDKELSIIWFTKIGPLFTLESVSRIQSRFVIRFQYHEHINHSNYSSLAIIPIGALPAGEYTIDMEHLPGAYRFTSDERLARAIKFSACRPFKLSVE